MLSQFILRNILLKWVWRLIVYENHKWSYDSLLGYANAWMNFSKYKEEYL